jgi:hypothetical protein
MAKSRTRLSLRLTPDNPIFAIPTGDRSRVADIWLRAGADVEKLEQLVAQLESIIRQADIKPAQQPVNQSQTKRNVATVLAAFE